jgi:DNA-binding beta-propeller fold protein YncE
MVSMIVMMIVLAPLLVSAPGGASSAAGTLLVANKGEHTMGLIDPEAGKQVTTVTETGITGHEVIASPDGRRAFVPIYGNSGVGSPGTDGSTLDVIDLASHKVIHTIDFGHGVRPHCPMFGPKDGLLYVTTELDDAITVIDPHSYNIVGKIPTGAAESHMLAITTDGKLGYTANVGPGTVSALDMVGHKTIAVIKVAEHVQRISVSNDGRWVFTSDTEKPRLAVIDTATNKVDRWIPLTAEGYGSAATPDGKWLLVAMPSAPGLAVIDLSTMQVAHNVSLPPAPQEVIVRPDGGEAYVSCDQSRKVAVVSTADWKVEKLIDAGKSADGLAWAPAH